MLHCYYGVEHAASFQEIFGAKDSIGRISLTQLAILLPTRPGDTTISLPPVAYLAKAAVHFAKEQQSLECVEALSTLPELRTRVAGSILETV